MARPLFSEQTKRTASCEFNARITQTEYCAYSIFI